MAPQEPSRPGAALFVAAHLALSIPLLGAGCSGELGGAPDGARHHLAVDRGARWADLALATGDGLAAADAPGSPDPDAGDAQVVDASVPNDASGVDAAAPVLPGDHPDAPVVLGLTKIVVKNDAELDAALGAFGSTYSTATHYLELASGATFKGPRAIKVGGKPGAPLILRGAVPPGTSLGDMSGRATIKATWTLAAPWIWLDRLRVLGTKSSWALQLLGEHAHVTRCSIVSGGWFYIPAGGKHFRIGWNSLRWETPDAGLDGFLIKCSNASKTVVRAGQSIKLGFQTLALAPYGGKIYRNDMFDMGPFDNPGGGDAQVVYVADGIKKVYYGSDKPDVDVEVLNHDGMWPIELSHNRIVTSRQRSLYLKHGGDLLYNDVEHRGNKVNNPTKGSQGTFGWRGGGAALGGATLRMWGNRVKGATAIQLYASGSPDLAGTYAPVMDVRGNDWSGAAGEIGVPVKNLQADGGKNVQYDTNGARFYGNRGKLRFYLRGGGSASWPRWRKAHDVVVYGHKDPGNVDLSGPHNDGTCTSLPALPAGVAAVAPVILSAAEVGCGGKP